MNYLTVYYWFTVIIFFLWVIIYTTALFIPVEHDSSGDPVDTPSYQTRNTMLMVGKILMWIFIGLMVLFFLSIFYSIPLDKEERSNTFPYNMFIKNKEK